MKKLYKVPYKSEGFIIVEAEDTNKAMDEAEYLITKTPIGFQNTKFSDPLVFVEPEVKSN